MPIDRIIPLESGGALGVWHITESYDELLPLALLTEQELAVCNGFRTEYRKREWLAVRAALFALLGTKKEIGYLPTGKPFLEGNYISITHTRNYVAVSLSVKPTAIDLEYPSERVLKIASRFMAKTDWDLVQGNEDWLPLLLIWSAKEVLYKYYDATGVLFDSQLFVREIAGHLKGTLTGAIRNGVWNEVLQMKFVVEPEYLLVYC